jgi:type VI secretion system (T6SS) phospholipase Tle1-like effector
MLGMLCRSTRTGRTRTRAWGSSANPGPPRKPSDPDWLQQVWFAGNHSDVGGSYPENEARLSDIALEWMAHAAENLPDEATPTGFGIKLNRQLLQLRPDPAGPQHDAREPGYLWGRLKWKLGLREIRSDAVLHSSVFKRFAADKVLHYYEAKAYRPGNLSKHGKLEEYYGQGLQEPPAPA